MSQPAKTHLRDLSISDLRDLVLGRGEPEYRFRQLCQWLYAKVAEDFPEMTDLSKILREALASAYVVCNARTVSEQVSRIDGTRKYLLEFPDGVAIESVLMTYEKRTTLCISTQAGCPLDCVFCATAKGRFQRDLSRGEILDQICLLKSRAGLAGKKVNVVFMGMGEPLLNYKELVGAIRTMNDPLGLNLGSKRITVSTSGFPGRIRRLADEGIKCSLALSLNAANDKKRARLMPKASQFPIAEMLDAARYFVSKNGRRVTLEYILLRGVNTSDEDADQLGKLVKGSTFKLNLIPYNPGKDEAMDRVTERDIQRFVKRLLPVAPAVMVRRSRGADIDAACGQLWVKNN